MVRDEFHRNAGADMEIWIPGSHHWQCADRVPLLVDYEEETILVVLLPEGLFLW